MAHSNDHASKSALWGRAPPPCGFAPVNGSLHALFRTPIPRSGIEALAKLKLSLGAIDALTPDPGLQDFGIFDFVDGAGEDISIQDYEVG